jgi:hypothetical protein
MNQKYILSGILVLWLLIWVSVTLSVTGDMGIIPMFESGINEGHHGMMGIMDGDGHSANECDEHDTHVEEDYECDNYETEDYCNQTVNHMDC